MKEQLSRHCTLHWWNMGTKTLSFKGTLKDLLKNQGITYTKKKSEIEGFYYFTFKSQSGITYKVRDAEYDFAYQAKKFVQMELVRMGDKATLYVEALWRPTVTVNH
jgi:hypothetical protein